MATQQEITELFETLLDNNPNEPLLINQDDILTAIGQAAATSLAEHDDRADTFANQVFIDRATGDELELLAAVVSVFRRTDESDTKLRIRTKAAYAQATSGTTINDFATVVKTVLGATKNEISITDAGTSEPVVSVKVSNSVVERAPLTRPEIRQLINKSVPASHNITIPLTGTFRLDGPDYSPPDNSGLNNGTLSGEL